MAMTLEDWIRESNGALRQARDQVVRMACNTPKEYKWPALTALAIKLSDLTLPALVTDQSSEQTT